MSEVWLYYITYIVEEGGRVGFSAKIMPLSQRLDSPETVVALTNALTEEVFPDGVPVEFADKKTLPVTILTWQLLTAKRGEAVEPPKPSSARPRSRRSH